MILRIVTSRHSPFYSPVICLVSGGFLERQGLSGTLGGLALGDTSHAALRDGRADAMQSAVSTNWGLMEKGVADLPVHFAQVNQRDGFFLAARLDDPEFGWKKLEGKTLLADHGEQPLAMLKYAAYCEGVDWGKVGVVDAGSPAQMLAAFRSGMGDYVHLQGPGPQELELEGAGHVVAMVGRAMPATAFSSLCATRAFVESAAFPAFLRAFAKAKEWARTTRPDEVAANIAPFFPGVAEKALAASVARYQELGNWDGGIAISRDLYEQSLNVFEQSGAITRRHAYEQVCHVPPEG
jgi:NitT/TauT family transport system substrate-binding protein